VWQALHEELAPAGVVIVTVALDTDIEAARPFHEAARPTHPALVDPGHVTVGLFGMTNVPFAIWIDEDGTIVRPAEVAFTPHEPGAGPDQSAFLAQLPERQRRVVEQMMATTSDRDRYVAAVRDWAAHGAASRFVLGEAEVVERSRPRPPEFGLAAAHFELAEHLHRAGSPRDAVAHFQEAHRLDPTNWSYHRQALSLVDPAWGPVYERDVLSEVDAVGVETFYPRLDMGTAEPA
jgi:hypothetical protein